jgi:hypothetical protein
MNPQPGMVALTPERAAARTAEIRAALQAALDAIQGPGIPTFDALQQMRALAGKAADDGGRLIEAQLAGEWP